MKVVCTNRRARADYHLYETFEAGMVLKGTEAKSLRDGKANLKDSYAELNDGEVYLKSCHISEYTYGNITNHDPLRSRKLLLNKREIKRLFGKIAERGYTLIPLRIYFKKGFAKVEIAVAKGKRHIDKRETIKKRDQMREIDREMRKRRR